jgi:ectoine hydroxylase-related dioxygenase (phytanoyl-CoA dioxygenase family)
MTMHEHAVEAINEHGFYIFEDAFDADLCQEILDEIDWLQSHGIPQSLVNDFHGHNTIRYYDVLNYGAVWQRVATHPNLLPIVRSVLGRDCLLNTYGTSIIGPGETAQPMHVDDGPFIGAAPALRRRPRSQSGSRESIVVNTMIALCDFTEEIGATRIVPDSNKLPYPKPHDSEMWYDKSIPAEMRKGSILFFDGQCFHGGGANTTDDQYRFAVSVDYCAGYLRTQENFMLSIGARAADFAEDLQQLIGFKLSRGGLGHVYNHNPQGPMKRVAMRNALQKFENKG